MRRKAQLSPHDNDTAADCTPVSGGDISETPTAAPAGSCAGVDGCLESRVQHPAPMTDGLGAPAQAAKAKPPKEKKKGKKKGAHRRRLNGRMVST